MTKALLRFDGKVVLITGAGQGIGREYALLFADRGAAVVVNDLGGNRHGAGRSTLADEVVREIKRKGGRAVASFDSVEHGDKIVKTAIDSFGKLDIVVNNAGILRDKSFQNMSDADWDAVQLVHLKGAFSVTKAAWPFLQKHKFGRVIFTSSTTGIYGRFGQANYAAAKSALIGLSNTLALEGAKFGIQCNTIVPSAGSRLTADVMPGDLHKELKPGLIAPLVAWLSHESCAETGGVFEAGGGWFGKSWARGEGQAFSKHHEITPENVRDNWAQIADMDNAEFFKTANDAMTKLVGSMEAASTINGREDEIAKQRTFTYAEKDVILYALAVGFTPSTLRLVYENDAAFGVFPLFAAVPGLQTLMGMSYPPELNLDMTKALHGEQYFQFFRPFPKNGTLRNQAKILDILDKRSGALILIQVETFDNAGNKLCSGVYDIFVVGGGNFGGKRSSTKSKPTEPVPKRAPDVVVEDVTSSSQAAIYRLGSLDFNPIHIDPSFAAAIGLQQPILHGLCSLGFVGRRLLELFGANDVGNLKELKARFAGRVRPGQTLVTEFWRNGQKVHFQTKVKESGELALSDGYAIFQSVTASGNSNSTPVALSSAKNTIAGSSAGAGLESANVFSALSSRLSAQPDLAKRVKAIFLWVITKAGKEAAKWTVDLKSSSGTIYEGEPKDGSKADVTLTLDDAAMVALANGKLNAQQAFLTGKLKLKGNIMLAQKLQTLFKDVAKL